MLLPDSGSAKSGQKGQHIETVLCGVFRQGSARYLGAGSHDNPHGTRYPFISFQVRCVQMQRGRSDRLYGCRICSVAIPSRFSSFLWPNPAARVPGCDHGVPLDISWNKFAYLVKLLAQVTVRLSRRSVA